MFFKHNHVFKHDNLFFVNKLVMMCPSYLHWNSTVNNMPAQCQLLPNVDAFGVTMNIHQSHLAFKSFPLAPGKIVNQTAQLV